MNFWRWLPHRHREAESYWEYDLWKTEVCRCGAMRRLYRNHRTGLITYQTKWHHDIDWMRREVLDAMDSPDWRNKT